MSTETVPNLRDLQAALSRPFPSESIEVKPGALTKDRSRGLALAYGDPRKYMERLDEVIGPEQWSVTYTVLPNGITCRLTILGIAKEDVGDYPTDSGDQNRLTTAAMQAFKRACALFGLGRYLYELPQVWAEYDEARRGFKDPRAVIHQIYTLAGLTADGVIRADHAAPPSDEVARPRPPAATTASAAPPDEISEKLARARAAHATAEARARTNGSTARTNGNATRAATERQLAVLRDRDMAALARDRFGVERLEDLSFNQASALIAEIPTRAVRR